MLFSEMVNLDFPELNALCPFPICFRFCLPRNDCVWGTEKTVFPARLKRYHASWSFFHFQRAASLHHPHIHHRISEIAPETRIPATRFLVPHFVNGIIFRPSVVPKMLLSCFIPNDEVEAILQLFHR